MKLKPLLLTLALAAPACDDGSSSRCADVVCDGASTCSEDDGLCHCGEGGPVCEPPNDFCPSAEAGCMPEACASVVCTVEGTACESDGLCHCGPGGPVCDTDERCDAEASQCIPVIPDPVCTAGQRWTPGTAIFRESTEEWGLEGVEGTRLNLADIDGDGYVDLLVRRGPTAADDFTSGGARNTWLLRNDGGTGFIDITRESGLFAMRGDDSGDTGRPNTIAAFADVDNDGDIDAFTGTATTDPAASLDESSEVMLNDGNGRFAFATPETNMELRWLSSPAGASFIDVDLDGNVDLWVPQASGAMGPLQDRLLIGDGTGVFTEDTLDYGLGTRGWSDIDVLNEGRAHTWGWGAAACDLNGDGITELMSPSYARAPNHLWQGQRDETGRVSFINRSVASGYAYDGDMTWQDNQFAACYCRDNPEAEGCDEVGPPQVVCDDNWDHSTDREPFRLGGNSASTFCADIDNDGDIDLFTGEIRHWWAGVGSDGSELLVNTGEHDVVFERPGDAATGLEADHLGRTDWDEGHMTNAVFDFDNDGWLDVYIGASDYPGNRGMLYHQESPRSFVQVETDDFFEHNRSHGVVFADLDRDGDLDIVVGHSLARCEPALPNDCYPTMQVRLFENVMENGNWIQLQLEGTGDSNRAAIGARVTVTSADVTQTQEVGGGFGHYGAQNDMVLHFGLGEGCEAEVTVRWPDAALTETSYTLPAGHRFFLMLGTPPRVAR
jgi:hypothetical protein